MIQGSFSYMDEIPAANTHQVWQQMDILLIFVSMPIPSHLTSHPHPDHSSRPTPPSHPSPARQHCQTPSTCPPQLEDPAAWPGGRRPPGSLSTASKRWTVSLGPGSAFCRLFGRWEAYCWAVGMFCRLWRLVCWRGYVGRRVRSVAV